MAGTLHPWNLATPRSTTLTENPGIVRNTFSGLRSRCTMAISCMSARPSATSMAIDRARSTPTGPLSRRNCLSVKPLSSSITIHTSSSWTRIP